jgi:hypothetical protein
VNAPHECGDEENPAASEKRRLSSAHSDRLSPLAHSDRLSAGGGRGARSPRQVMIAPHGGASGPKSRVAAPLRFLLRLALAVVTVVIFAVTASHGRASVSVVVSAVHVAAAERADAASGALPDQPSHRWQDRVPRRPLSDLKAVELEDDDDDPLRGVSDVAAQSFCCVPDPRNPGHAFPRGELQVDTSRFAACTGLPRGPPA